MLEEDLEEQLVSVEQTCPRAGGEAGAGNILNFFPNRHFQGLRCLM